MVMPIYNMGSPCGPNNLQTSCHQTSITLQFPPSLRLLNVFGPLQLQSRRRLAKLGNGVMHSVINFSSN